MRAGQSISLDFMLKNSIKNIAKQNDINSRFLKITLRINRQAVTLYDTAIATLNITRSDGQKNSYIAVIEDNMVKVFLSDRAVELEGILLCDVSIIENNERLTTMPFKIEVVKACCTTGDIIDKDSEDILTNLYTLLQRYEGYDLDGIKDRLEELETIVDGLDNKILFETVTIQQDDWQLDTNDNKYKCTVNKDTVTSDTYIIANEISNVLFYAEIQSNNGSYTLTAPERPSGAVNLLLIFLKGGDVNERSI